MAVIEFTPDGTIVSANKNFQSTSGYQEHEIVNKHQVCFVLRAMRTVQNTEPYGSR